MSVRIESIREFVADSDSCNIENVSFDTDNESKKCLDSVSIDNVSPHVPALPLTRYQY